MYKRQITSVSSIGYGVYIENTGDCIIKNNIIRGFRIGIQVFTGGNQIIGNHIYVGPATSIDVGIQLGNSTVGIQKQIVTSNIIDNPSVAGIKAYIIKGVIINDNIIYWSSASGTEYGIYIDRTTSGSLTLITIKNNYIYSTS